MQPLFLLAQLLLFLSSSLDINLLHQAGMQNKLKEHENLLPMRSLACSLFSSHSLLLILSQASLGSRVFKTLASDNVSVF